MFFCLYQVTRLIPDSKGTSCNQRLERVSGTEHSYILRVPFRSEQGILRKWISRFDVWPYLETFAMVNFTGLLEYFLMFLLMFPNIYFNTRNTLTELLFPLISGLHFVIFLLFLSREY